jgi:hypothetical protein
MNKPITSDTFRNISGIVCDYKNSCKTDLINNGYDFNSLPEEDVILYKKSDNDIIFCHPLFLDQLLQQIDISDKILITHNSDATIVSYKEGNVTFKFLTGQEWSISNVTPKRWLAQNNLADIIESIPLGTHSGNPIHSPKYIKTSNVYVNFGLNTNPSARLECQNKINLPNLYNTNKSQSDFLNELSSHRFIISPEGFGIDCHRHWESLYVGTIPIVLKNKLTENLSKIFPIVVLNDWDNFKIEEYNEDTYQTILSKYDLSLLDAEKYISFLNL